MNQTEIRRYLNVIKRAVSFIEQHLDDDGGLLEQLVEAPPVEPVTPPVEPVMPPVETVVKEAPSQPDEAWLAARNKHLQDLLSIDCWPEAVPSVLANATPSAEDQQNRANAVLDMMLHVSPEGKTFLDFGCGEGWIAQEAMKRGASESFGYDIKVDPDWNQREGVSFVGDFAGLPQNHFDIIMLYDVLDHCHEPVDVMLKVLDLLKQDGVVYARCHPWTARHATHLYKQGINRAYWHLFAKWHEIQGLIGQEPFFTRIEKDPITAYHWWFHDFKIERERQITEPVSEFFHVPAFKELLAAEQELPHVEIDNFLSLMAIQFVDYILVKS